MTESKSLRSPNGRWAVRTSPWEARMSLWIESPCLVDAASGAPIFAFRDVHWSLDSATWIGDDIVQWQLRKYPGNHLPVDLAVQIDCARRIAMCDGREFPLTTAEAALDARLRWITSAE